MLRENQKLNQRVTEAEYNSKEERARAERALETARAEVLEQYSLALERAAQREREAEAEKKSAALSVQHAQERELRALQMARAEARRELDSEIIEVARGKTELDAQRRAFEALEDHVEEEKRAAIKAALRPLEKRLIVKFVARKKACKQKLDEAIERFDRRDKARQRLCRAKIAGQWISNKLLISYCLVATVTCSIQALFTEWINPLNWPYYTLLALQDWWLHHDYWDLLAILLSVLMWLGTGWGIAIAVRGLWDDYGWKFIWTLLAIVIVLLLWRTGVISYLLSLLPDANFELPPEVLSRNGVKPLALDMGSMSSTPDQKLWYNCQCKLHAQSGGICLQAAYLAP